MRKEKVNFPDAFSQVNKQDDREEGVYIAEVFI